MLHLPSHRRLSSIARAVVEPENASAAGALAAVVGAAVGVGATVAYGRLNNGKKGEGEADAPATAPGALGPAGTSPDGKHQYRGFGAHPRGSSANQIDLSELKGGVAVITGGASGIGFALSTAAVEHGMNVMMA